VIEMMLALLLIPECGNGVVDEGEDCITCPLDVPCTACEMCNADGDCEPVNCVDCGNGIIDPGETCFTCPADFVCPNGTICQMPSQECVGYCGNGEPDPGETCFTCPEDIVCPLNANCIAHECVTPKKCIPDSELLEVVFIFDTSGSMSDEGAALCGQITMIESQLEALGLDVEVTILGISGQINPPFDCLEGTVHSVFGVLHHMESWGPATATVAEMFPWQTDSRIIVPLSDEGPFAGNPCFDPGADRDSIDNAIIVANDNNVFVSPIAGTSSGPCTIKLGMELAAGTGGIFFESTDPGFDIAGAIEDLVTQTLCGCVWDLNNDGEVGIMDFLIMLAFWDDYDIVAFLALLGDWGCGGAG